MMVAKLLLLSLVALVVFSLAESRPSPGQGGAQVICKQPEYRGHCRALLPRWMYNPTIGKCQEFRFGGCDSNGNNFKSYKSCMAICGGIK